MILINIVVVCVSTFLVQNVVGEPPKFRILAPPFVCPKDKDAIIEKPDKTVITLQTEAGTPLQFHWTIRWHPLVDAPTTQRFTLLLWDTVRELELKLNEPQLEPNVFIINNTQLLSGVNYIFSVTATTTCNDDVGTEVFQIDNISGDPKLLIGGRSNMFSVVLIGGQPTYADIDFMLDAQVTACYRTHDYFFVWTVSSGEDSVAVSDVKGSRLVIRANTLTPGHSYDVLCQVYKYSNGDFITQNSLQFHVLHRRLSVNFNIDLLVITVDTPFKLYTDINRLDYIEHDMTMAWECTFGGETVATFYSTDNEGALSFPSGLRYVGEYLITLTVTALGQSMADQAIVKVTDQEPKLPVIQVLEMPPMLNEGSVVTIKANVTNVVPGCSITWYSMSQQCLVSESSTATDICDSNEHGTRISEPIKFYSLEENFLSALTDYTNETSWKAVSVDMEARAGRVRVVAECQCAKGDNCTGDREVYADVILRVNDKPKVGSVLVMPEFGTAMETVFRLSTLPVMDTTRPLSYSFFVRLTNNDTLLLGSYLEHMAVETLLPYIEGGTYVWVEVCDSLGACSDGATSLVPVTPGDARTLEALLEDARAHMQRCELMMLIRLATSAVFTYINAGQAEALVKFTTSLLHALGGIEERCIVSNYDQYNEFIYRLQSAGIDTTTIV